MLTINNRKFARNNSEFIDSLFTSGGTCIGYYRKLKNGVKLMDQQKNPIMFIVDNSYGEQFVVSARTVNGRTRYMFALTNRDENTLGFNNLSWSEQHAAAKSALSTI